ncbi:MAG: hypothetical protein WDW38_005226 [Sanguina aurantia]
MQDGVREDGLGGHQWRQLLNRELGHQKSGAAVDEVEVPDVGFCRFTPCGQFLVSGLGHQEFSFAFVCPFNGFIRKTHLSHTANLQAATPLFGLQQTPRRTCSFFSLSYTATIARGRELLCRDFCMFLLEGSTLLLASQTQLLSPNQSGDRQLPECEVPSAPYAESTTFHMVRLQDGHVLDTECFHSDYIPLRNNNGASLYGDVLAVMAVRSQTIHILQILPSGALARVRSLGPYCQVRTGGRRCLARAGNHGARPSCVTPCADSFDPSTCAHKATCVEHDRPRNIHKIHKIHGRQAPGPSLVTLTL